MICGVTVWACDGSKKDDARIYMHLRYPVLNQHSHCVAPDTNGKIDVQWHGYFHRWHDMILTLTDAVSYARIVPCSWQMWRHRPSEIVLNCQFMLGWSNRILMTSPVLSDSYEDIRVKILFVCLTGQYCSRRWALAGRWWQRHTWR